MLDSGSLTFLTFFEGFLDHLDFLSELVDALLLFDNGTITDGLSFLDTFLRWEKSVLMFSKPVTTDKEKTNLKHLLQLLFVVQQLRDFSLLGFDFLLKLVHPNPGLFFRLNESLEHFLDYHVEMS